jgi:restriction endonuclease S subunit
VLIQVQDALKVKNILGVDGLDFNDTEYIGSVPSSKILRANDILSPFIGQAVRLLKFSMLPATEQKFVADNNCGIIRPNPEAIFPPYLLEALRSRFCGEQILQLIGGGGVPFLGAANAKKILIPLPPREVQRRLASEMEAAREERRRKLAQADELISSFDAWLLTQLGLEPPPADNHKVFAIRFGDIQGRVDPYFYQPRFEKVMRELAASRFPLKTIGDICEQPVGGATPTRGDAELYADAGIKFLRILNIKPNEIDLADVKHIRDSVHNGELSRSQLAADDVLMTITGRVGTAAVVPQDILPANINQHIVRLHVTSAECLPDYLAAYLNSSVGLAISNRSVTGGTRIALDYQAIRSLPVPIPPRNRQEAIIGELNKRRLKAGNLRREAEVEWQAAKRRFEEQLLTRGAKNQRALS